VVVSFHWGVEYVTEPTQRQIDLAHLAIDAGADIILGNHPHWVQPVEIYKDKCIIYAHGNFVFDQEWSEETKRGVVGRYTFYEGKLVDVEYLPIRIVDYGQPYFLKGTEAEQIMKHMKEVGGR
jgi:poly-gamma-glutamate synthesis protein (capsule biosynthesis protein)